MASRIVVGAQWGDEGKGKIVDIMASCSDIVVRAQGGDNAGHTVKHGEQLYKLRVIPSGILYENVECMIGCGVVLNPKSLIDEMKEIASCGVSLENLYIDFRAHLIMPWHIVFDRLSEKLEGNDRIGTTGRGIGPCYKDKAERTGIRVCDMLDAAVIEKKVLKYGTFKNRVITQLYGHDPLDLQAIVQQYTKYGQILSKYVKDVSVAVYDALNSSKNVLFEGAQGAMLDIDFGTYPFVTSSNPIAGGICTGAGIGPTAIDEVVGVAKAYSTRVGSGPFPTEIVGDIAKFIRKNGHEFGTNTGRLRRIGWLDAVALKHAVRTSGFTGIVLNKLDILRNIDVLKIGYAYRSGDNNLLKDFSISPGLLNHVEPVYKEFSGFNEDITRCVRYSDLPYNCKKYIDGVENMCGCKVIMVGVGPGKDQYIVRDSA